MTEAQDEKLSLLLNHLSTTYPGWAGGYPCYWKTVQLTDGHTIDSLVSDFFDNPGDQKNACYSRVSNTKDVILGIHFDKSACFLERCFIDDFIAIFKNLAFVNDEELFTIDYLAENENFVLYRYQSKTDIVYHPLFMFTIFRHLYENNCRNIGVMLLILSEISKRKNVEYDFLYMMYFSYMICRNDGNQNHSFYYMPNVDLKKMPLSFKDAMINFESRSSVQNSTLGNDFHNYVKPNTTSLFDNKVDDNKKIELIEKEFNKFLIEIDKNDK